jgi:hypothetical protein
VERAIIIPNNVSLCEIKRMLLYFDIIFVQKQSFESLSDSTEGVLLLDSGYLHSLADEFANRAMQVIDIFPQFIEQDPNYNDDIYGHFARLMAVLLRQDYDIAPLLEDAAYSDVRDTQRTQVLKVVLNELPIIDESVNINDLLALKEDKDTKLKYLALRNWMIDLAVSELTPQEIHEKFQFLYFQYVDHIESFKLKSSHGKSKTILFAAGKALENVVTGKFVSAVECLDIKSLDVLVKKE